MTSSLQNLLEISFLQEALFSLIEDSGNYAPLLVVNHHDRYLTLSNEDHYIFLLPEVSLPFIAEVCEQANYIFNRKKILVQLEDCEEIADFEHQFCLKVSDLIRNKKAV